MNDNDICECCEKDENGDWIHSPCCDISGVCEADTKDKGETLSWCKHCGGQMFKEYGFWFHHEQEEIPINERKAHLGV